MSVQLFVRGFSSRTRLTADWIFLTFLFQNIDEATLPELLAVENEMRHDSQYNYRLFDRAYEAKVSNVLNKPLV